MSMLKEIVTESRNKRQKSIEVADSFSRLQTLVKVAADTLSDDEDGKKLAKQLQDELKTYGSLVYRATGVHPNKGLKL